MYRKDNGKLGMKPFNHLGDLPGSLASSSGADPGHISSPQQDSIYLYQLQFPNPCALTDETLHVSKIIDHPSTSRKVFKQLQNVGLVKTDGEVDTAVFGTSDFGKVYTRSLAMIPAYRQKQVVDLLFWWDDEARRLRKLMEEREELTTLKASAQDAAHQDRLQLLLDRVLLKIRTRPSERVAELERDEDLVNTEATTQPATDNDARGENPPAYE